MHTIQAYFERFGGNFLVAAFVPSLAFVTASILLFGPVIPPDVLEQIEYLLGPLGENNIGWAIFLVAVIIGFTLSSLNTYIYKLYEGYVLYKYLPLLRSREINRARDFRSKRDSINKKIHQLERRIDLWNETQMPPRSEKEMRRLKNQIQVLKAERNTISVNYDQQYPPNENLVLPSRFGNILRASETYPRIRWGIDAVTMWPRLIYAVSIAPKGEEYLAKVDISNDQCSFLLNSSLLSGLFSGLALLVSVYQAVMLHLRNQGIGELLYFIPVSNTTLIYQQRIFIYLAISIMALVVFWFFYTASLYNVTQYGDLIRSTYDLFHLNLLKALHLDELHPDELPKDTVEEKEIWQRVCEFIEIGEVNGPFKFDYVKSEHPKTV
ncbi:MAG: hypothetical protein ACOYZ6_12780 [Chloroflexota bacterium]